MAIRNVLLVTSDTEYSHRLCRYINENHPDVKMTLVNNADNLKTTISQSPYSVMLIDEEFASVKVTLPQGMNCGWLSARDSGIDIQGYKSFCKYRSGETLYNIILELYSEVTAEKMRESISNIPIYAFTGANGGAGATLISAAFAVKLAMMGKNVLFLSFDKYCKPSLVFGAEATDAFSQFLYYVMSSEKRTLNLSAKAASMLSKDYSGVRYMDGFKTTADMDELTPERLTRAFNSLINSDEYNAVVVDVPFENKMVWGAIRNMNKICILSEPGDIPRQKLVRILQGIQFSDERNGTEYMRRCSVVLNKTQPQDQVLDNIFGAPVLGAIPRYKDDNLRGILDAVCKLQLWNSFVI